MTNTPRQCPKCGSTLAPDAPEGLCPACLMAGALPTDATIKLTPSQMRAPSHGPVAPPPEELAPLFPQLEIMELLGRGGMGAVYKARQPKLNRFVALKIIAGDAAADPHFAERFQREAQALAKLNHPNIVSVFDFGETGGLFYFLMEFVDGANLRTLMQSGEMKPEAALALIPAFCDALQYAHDEGVVHRDIKPENVLVDKKGRLKIADFGLAKLTGADAHDHTLTRTGMYLGTPRYMAPEQVEKPETVDHRADIYSLGVVFYEMLTGELPMGRFDPPSKKVDVDVKLDDIVLRSLEKEPARRYQHASEIKTDVQGVTAKPQAVVTPAANSDDENVEEDEVEVMEHPVFAQIWRFFPLGVILLVFISMFSSWGSNIWPYFGIGVAVLAVASGCFSTITRKKDGMQKTAVSTPDSSAPRLSRMALISLLGVAAFGLTHIVQIAVWTEAHTSYSSDDAGHLINPRAPNPANRPDAGFLVLDVLAATAVCLMVARFIRRKAPGKGVENMLEQHLGEPRSSGLAIGGAIWGIAGLLAAGGLALLYFNYYHEVGGRLVRPGDWTRIASALWVMAGASVIGTTILGAISMSNIKKSGGKLYGLPLAFADAVFFPMLLLHGAMAVMLGLLILTIMKLAGVNAGLGAVEMGLLAMLPLIADFFIVRAFWRKVSGAELSSSPSVAQPFAGSGMHLALCVLLSVMTLWFVLEFGFPVVEMITGPDLPLIEIGRQWHLGSTVDSIFSKFAAILALLGAGTFFSWRSYRRAVRDGLSAAATGGDSQTRSIIIAATVVVVIVGVALLFRARPGSGGSATSLLGNLFTSDSALIVAEEPGTQEPDHDLCRYKISAPPNHRVVMWMEVTREGKPVVLPGLANRIEIAEQLPIGESFEGGAEFSLMDGSRISPDSKGKWRWDFKFNSRTMRTAPGGWIDNPFEGKGMRQMDLGPQRWQPKPGETVSIMVIRAGKQFSGSDFTQQPPAGEIELRLKARIDLVPLFHRRVSGISSTSSAPYPAPEKPLSKIAAGFEIDTKLSDDDIRRALIEKLRTNPDKRRDAEAILKSVGKPVTKEAKPEDVLKALEQAAQDQLPPSAAATSAGSSAKVLKIQQDRSQIPATRAVGREDYAWKFTAPPGHTLDVWMESWRDGKREIVGRFTFRAKPRLGDELQAALWLQTLDGNVASVESKGQMRFDWGMSCGSKSNGERNGEWRPDIFKGCSSVGSNWDNPASATLHAKSGEIVTVLEVLGRSVGQTSGWSEESLQKGSPTAALLIRARLNPAMPGELSTEGSGALSNGALSIVPPLKSADAPKLEILKDASQVTTTAPGRQDYAFKFSGPADHTLNVWMEVWQEGKMEWVNDFDFEAKPKAGEPLAASLTLTALGGDAPGNENQGKTRLEWSMNCGGSEGKSHKANALIADLSKGMGATYSTWDRQPKTLNPRPGETVTVLGITGFKLSNLRSVLPVHTEADLLKRWPNAAVLVRARFSPLHPDEADGKFKPARKPDDGATVSVNVSDKAYETRSFAQFEISKHLGVDLSPCRTQTDAHAALVEAASTPDGHARAAQMIDEFGSDNIGFDQVVRGAVEPMQNLWWQLRKKEPVSAEQLISTLEQFITDLNGAARYSIWWLHGEPITQWAGGPFLNEDFAKKLKLTKLQIDEVNKLFKKYADEANALSRRHTKVTRNDQGHVLISIEPYSEECLELARKMVAELGGIVTQDIVPAVKVGALPSAIFGNAGECRETIVLKKNADGVYVIEISRRDWVRAGGSGNGNGTTSWGSKDIDLAFGSYKMYWTEE